MFSPLFLRELLSVLIILLHFLGLGYRTIISAEQLRVISTLSLRPNDEDVLGSRDQAPSSAVDWRLVSLTPRVLWNDTHSLGDRNNRFRYCSEEKKLPLRVPRNEPKLCVRASGSLVAIPIELQRSEEAAPVVLENAVFYGGAVETNLKDLVCEQFFFFLAALEVLRKGGQV